MDTGSLGGDMANSLLHEVPREPGRIVAELAEATVAQSFMESTGLELEGIQPRTVAAPAGCLGFSAGHQLRADALAGVVRSKGSANRFADCRLRLVRQLDGYAHGNACSLRCGYRLGTSLRKKALMQRYCAGTKRVPVSIASA